jgi:uncharacterized protein (DUF1015 family)
MEIRPFRGWRYVTEADRDVSAFLAPSYDILSAADKQALLKRSDRNIVAVDLPHVPPHEAGPEEEYRSAAATLEQWKSSGVLVQDPRPAIYAYEQTFRWAGKTCTRQALLCGVRATELGRDVIPHEHTFAGPKADRLKLTEATRMQLSPIFGFYEGSLAMSATRLPDAQGELMGVIERLWVIDDPVAIAAAADALRATPAFIADGHHRYATQMNYRDALRAKGLIDDNHEANFVLFALVARNDPGLRILPTHRVIRRLRGDFSLEELVRRTSDLFTWHSAAVDEAGLLDADSFLGRVGRGGIGFIGKGGEAVWIARLKDAASMAQAAPDRPEAWRRLDVAVLHKLVIEKALAPWLTDDSVLEYTPEGRAALKSCRNGSADLAVILHSTPLEAVEQIARSGASMPHKSTYFYPKLATGMVLKPLE